MAVTDAGEIRRDDFFVKILTNNNIPGLVSFSYEYIDGKTVLLYDISSKQSLEKYFETKKITFHILSAFLNSLRNASSALSEYLLNPEGILLRSDCIFTDYSHSRFYFCYCPGNHEESVKNVQSLITSLLSLIDYSDPLVIALAFDLNKIVQSDTFTLRDITDGTASHRFGNFAEEHGEDGECFSTGSDAGDICTTGASSSGSSQTKATSSDNSPARISFHHEDRGVSSFPKTRSLTFFQKAKLYFAGKSFAEIIDALNDWKIIENIKNSASTGGTAMPDAGPAKRAIPPISGPGLLVHDIDAFMEDCTYEEVALWPALHPENASNTASINKSLLLTRRLQGLGSCSKTTILIDHFPFTIGKLPSSDYVLDMPEISRMHCRFHKDTHEDGTFDYLIEDLNSTNGSYVNNDRLEAYTPATVTIGDQIRLADKEFKFI